MKYWLINHEENTKHSKYESKIKQTSIHVQVIVDMKWISVKYEIVIII